MSDIEITEEGTFFFDYKYQNESNGSKILPLAVEYLTQNLLFKEDITTFFTDKTAIDAYLFIAKLIAYESNKFDYTPFEANQFEIFVSQIMCHFSEKRNELHITQQKNELSSSLKSEQFFDDSTEVKLIALKCTLFMTNIIPSHSVLFATKFPKAGGLKTYLDFLQDDAFVTANLNTKLMMWDKKETLIIEYFILNISSLSKHCEDYKQKWIVLNTVDVLLKMSKLNANFKYLCYTGITNVADDAQIEHLEEIQDFADMQVEFLRKLHNTVLATAYKRDVRQIFDNNVRYDCEMLSLNLPNNISTSIYNILQGLYKLSINQKMKEDLFFKVKDYLKTFLAKGNMYEIKWTVRVLAQFSFDTNVALYLDTDADYMDFVNRTVASKPASDAHIFEHDTFGICAKISWNVSEAKADRDAKNNPDQHEEHEEETAGKAGEQSHIMISYNTGSRELCLKIKKTLESSGFKVWMDISDIHGSSLDAMAAAVENSCCVLICVTEKYRQSINCQSEAQYAFKLNKPIIPCIMQKGYETVTGWLGIIMGDKIFINFVKYELDECMRRLKGEITHHYKAPLVKEPKTGGKTGVETSQQKADTTSGGEHQADDSVDSWDTKKLNVWFEDKGLEQSLKEYISKCNGKLLRQFHDMKIKAPEFYYQSINKIANNDVMQIMLFSQCLEELFGKS
jgi:hypothetical protein